MPKSATSFTQEEPADYSAVESIWPTSFQELRGFSRLVGREKIHLLGFLCVFFFLPPFYFWANHTPKIINYVVFGVTAVFLAGYAWLGKFTFHELGLRKDTLKSGWWNYALFSLGLLSLLSILYWGQFARQAQQGAPTMVYLAFYIFLASPAQEFLYRGLLFAEMNRRGLRQPWLQILISGSLFGFLHVCHYDYVTVVLTLLIGLAWGVIYQKYPNLLWVSLSHIVLGTAAILFRLV